MFDRSGAQDEARKLIVKLVSDIYIAKRDADEYKYQYEKPLSDLELEWIQSSKWFMSMMLNELGEKRWESLSISSSVRKSVSHDTHPLSPFKDRNPKYVEKTPLPIDVEKVNDIEREFKSLTRWKNAKLLNTKGEEYWESLSQKFSTNEETLDETLSPREEIVFNNFIQLARRRGIQINSSLKDLFYSMAKSVVSRERSKLPALLKPSR